MILARLHLRHHAEPGLPAVREERDSTRGVEPLEIQAVAHHLDAPGRDAPRDQVVAPGHGVGDDDVA
jgi:hypothetical protein